MNKIFKLKIITLIILILQSSITFAAVSGFVDSKQVTQRRPMGVDFNSNGTKMFVVGTVENKIFEFDLTTGFDVSTCTNVEEHFAGEFNLVGIEFNPVEQNFLFMIRQALTRLNNIH